MDYPFQNNLNLRIEVWSKENIEQRELIQRLSDTEHEHKQISNEKSNPLTEV